MRAFCLTKGSEYPDWFKKRIWHKGTSDPDRTVLVGMKKTDAHIHDVHIYHNLIDVGNEYLVKCKAQEGDFILEDITGHIHALLPEYFKGRFEIVGYEDDL